MRLFRHILQNSLAFRQSRRHHNIDGGAHRHHIQIDMAAHQINGMGHHRALDDLHLRAQSPESL